MGPPGTFRTECAKQIGEETGWQPIQTGYLLKDEESKKTVLGSKINEAKKAYHYSKSSLIESQMLFRKVSVSVIHLLIHFIL